VNLHRYVPGIHSFGTALVVAAACLLSACAPTFPPIASTPVGDHGFKARIATMHPPGSRAAGLRGELAREGFVVVGADEGRINSAFWGADTLPCFSRVRIDWTEDRRGRISRIQAQRHDCS
jgi:hypothetical protein